MGRSILHEFSSTHDIRSVHRHRAPEEDHTPVEWIASDIAVVHDWRSLLHEIDLVINVAWYRSGSRRRFERLYHGLSRLLTAATESPSLRFLHISVPAAPPELERTLPYLTLKRRFDHDLIGSGLSYAIVRPTMLFGARDKLLGVMLRGIRRYPFFPLFGNGEYHVSPLAVVDLARILRQLAASNFQGTVDAGGPIRYRYKDLTDLMFRTVGKSPRYWKMSGTGAVRLARLLETFGSSLLYSYEVKWLLSDTLGLPPFANLDRPLERVEPYLGAEVRRLQEGGRFHASPPANG